MDQNRHRAPERHPRRPLVLASLGGVVAGALVVGLVWWITGASVFPSLAASPEVSPSVTAHDPTDRTTGGRSPEARNDVAVPTARSEHTSGTGDPVLLLGDSLAVGIGPYVDTGLGERPLTVDAAEGRGTATSVSLLTPYAGTTPPIWIVSLGTNDNPDEFEPQARSIMALAGPDRCVVWFDVWRAETDDSINATLSALAADHSNLHLIPWHETSALHYEWFSGTDVHPSSEGYAVRGQMAIDAVNEYCD